MPNQTFNADSLQRGICCANFTPHCKPLRRQAGSALPVNLALEVIAMLEYLPQAMSSLSTASSIAKTMLELRDFQQINSKVIELQQAIISAQQQVLSGQSEQATLAEKIQALENECTRLKDWTVERTRYTRREIGEGVFAYVANDQAGTLQSAHKLCCNCFDKAI